MRRILYSAGIVLGLAIVVLIGYWFRYQGGSPTQTPGAVDSTGGLPNDAANTSVEGLPTNTNGTGSSGTGATNQVTTQKLFGTISDKKISSYFAESENTISFVAADGEIARITNGTLDMLSSSPIPAMSESSFSCDGQKALVVLNGGQQATVFDLGTRTWELLPSDIRSPMWAPKSQEILYFTEGSGGAKQIFSIDMKAKTKKPQLLFSIAIEDIVLQWADQQVIVVGEKTSGLTPSSLFVFDIKKKTMTPIILDEPGIETAWDGSQQFLAFTVGDRGQSGKLTLRSGLGITVNTFSFLTFPEKCVFGSLFGSATTASSTASSTSTKLPAAIAKADNVVCAVPRDSAALSREILPDAYNKHSIYTSDDIFTIDLASGNVQTIRANDSENLDASNLSIKNKRLFFVNRFDNLLYFLSLATST